jgi:hypothetical protein
VSSPPLPNSRRRRRLPLAAPLTLALVALALLAPAAVSASSTQLSIMQDDATFVYGSKHDPEQAFAAAKLLGVDAIRVFLSWHSVSPGQDSRRRPASFDPGNPDSEGYNWQLYDQLVERARRHGLKLLVVLSPSIPYWASEQPSRCPHRIGGYQAFGFSCMWKPSPALFAQFVKAAARRYGITARGPYGGQVALWSLWNEPNLEHYLWPQLQKTRYGMVDLAAARYRKLWLAGWKAIAKYDPPSRTKVLFGETAAISSPIDTLYAALCLDEDGNPFKGRLRTLQGCGGRIQRLPIAGLAVHPYNNFALGSVFTVSHTKDSLPMGYLSRAHKVLDRAARLGRIPGDRGIYVTEFGFQSAPPNPFGDGLSLGRQAAAVNEADRLFFGDRRVRSVAQYELYDVGNPGEFNTGLLEAKGDPKPARDAYRMPLVVTRLADDRVEVWGQVRPASGRARPVVEIASGAGKGAVVGQPLTNARGYYRFVLRRRGAAGLRLRARWTDPDGDTLRSRVAAAGKPIKYQE